MYENVGVFIREKVWLENSLSQMVQAIFEPNLLPYKYSIFKQPSFIPIRLLRWKRVFRNVGI